MKPKLSETEVKKQIKDLLRAVGARPVSIGASVLGENGISDLLVCFNGSFIAIEVKKEGWAPPGRNARSYQHYWKQKCFLESIEAAGGIGFFAQSAEEVIKRLDLQAKLTPLFA